MILLHLQLYFNLHIKQDLTMVWGCFKQDMTSLQLPSHMGACLNTSNNELLCSHHIYFSMHHPKYCWMDQIWWSLKGFSSAFSCWTSHSLMSNFLMTQKATLHFWYILIELNWEYIRYNTDFGNVKQLPNYGELQGK